MRPLWVQAALELGPLALATVTAVVVLLTVWRLWCVQTARVAALSAALVELSAKVEALGDDVFDVLADTQTAVQNLRAEFHLGNTKAEAIKAGLLKLEGAIDAHQGLLVRYIASLERVDSKLAVLP